MSTKFHSLCDIVIAAWKRKYLNREGKPFCIGTKLTYLTFCTDG